MSADELPPIPTRPQRQSGSLSPAPTIPARPNSKSPTPQVPTRRPNRAKTSDLNDLMQNTDDQLKDMQNLIMKRSDDSKTHSEQLRDQEDNLQKGKEDLLGTNEMEFELQEEKERLLKKKEIELKERSIHQANREKELEMLEKRREELMLEREREGEQELRRQEELELEDEKQRELERKQELELETKRKELEQLEREHRLAREKSTRLEAKNTSSTEPKESLNSGSDAALEKVGGTQEERNTPCIPERPKKSQSPADMESKADVGHPKIPERRPRPIGRRSTETPAVPGRRPESLERNISGSPTVPESKPDTMKRATLAEFPSIPQRRPERLKKEVSDESATLSEKKPETFEKEPNESFSAPEKQPSSLEKKSSNGSSHSEKNPESTGIKSPAEPPVAPEKNPEPVEEKSTNNSPVLPEKRPETLEKKLSSGITTPSEKEPENLELKPSHDSPIAPERKTEPEEKKPSTEPLKGQSTVSSVETEKGQIAESNPESLPALDRKPEIGENTRELSSKPEIKRLESEELRTPPSDVSKQGSIESSVTSEQQQEKPKMEENSAKKLAVDETENEAEASAKQEEKKPEEPAKDAVKKKAPPVPKKPSSRIVAFQEMLRKQQMEEMQGSHRKGPEPVHLEPKGNNTGIDSSESSRPSVPQRPARQPINAERSKFANNLNGLFALPGMSPMGGLPPSFTKKLDPAASTLSQEKEKENQTPSSSASGVRPPRARGPRGRKLPSNVASVEKVSSESKTNEIEIFKTWKTVVHKREEPAVPERPNSLSRKATESDNEKAVEVTNPIHFDLDSDKAVRPLQETSIAESHGNSFHNTQESTVLPKEDIGVNESKITQTPSDLESVKKTEESLIPGRPLESQGDKQPLVPGRPPISGSSTISDFTKPDEPLISGKLAEPEEKEQQHEDNPSIPEGSSKKQGQEQDIVPERPSTSKSSTIDDLKKSDEPLISEKPAGPEGKELEQTEEPLIPERPSRKQEERQPPVPERPSTSGSSANFDPIKSSEPVVLEKPAGHEGKEQEHNAETSIPETPSKHQKPLVPERPLTSGSSTIHDFTKPDEQVVSEHEDEPPIPERPSKKQEEKKPLVPERPSTLRSTTADEAILSVRPTTHQGKEHENSNEPLIPQRPTRLTKESGEMFKSEHLTEKPEDEKHLDLPKDFPEVTEPVPETSFSLGSTENNSEKRSNIDLLSTVKDVGESQLQRSDFELNALSKDQDLAEKLKQGLKQDDKEG